MNRADVRNSGDVFNAAEDAWQGTVDILPNNPALATAAPLQELAF